MNTFSFVLRATVVSTALTLAACGGSSNDDNDTSTQTPEPPVAATPDTYEVRIFNVTANQPLAPTAVIVHDEDYSAWQIGAAASEGLEMLAEGGSPMALLEAADDTALDTSSTEGILAPGLSAETTVSAVWEEGLSITIVAMPVNTNDAFTGTTGMDISGLEPGQSMRRLLPIYDAGTEANTETAETMPGPAAGGEGFNSVRDDIADYVTRHGGVVTADDGATESALNESHRFDQGAMIAVITRMEENN